MPQHSPKPFGSNRHRPRKRSAEAVPPEFADASRGVRLQKVLAAAGIASRRDAEEMILAGRVMVNGHRITALPAWVDPAHDRIEVDGTAIARPRKSHRAPAGHAPGDNEDALTSRQPPDGRRHPLPPPDVGEGLRAAMAPLGLLYVMLHKPRKVISTTRDPEQRRSVTDMVSIEGIQGPARLFPVGRLDADSTGLILLTNDGELANRLTHARYGVTKEYLVSVKGRLEDADVARFEAELNPHRQKSGGGEKSFQHRGHRGHGEERDLGLEVGGQGSRDSRNRQSAIGNWQSENFSVPSVPSVLKSSALRDEQVRIISRQKDVSRGDRTQLKVVLREGQHRGVRRLMAWLGFKVRRIQRVAIGPLQLKGLTPGRWRFLEPNELRALKQAVGM